jgi:hypothetical protein
MIAAACLSRRLRRLLTRPIAAATAVVGADAYRKHFPVTAHCWILLWHGLSATPSLRQSHAIADADPTFWTRIGLPATGISRSQLARSSTSRPPGCLEQVFAALPSGRPAGPRPWEAVHLVDSTFLTLSGQLAPWSRHGKHPPGVRVHTGYDLAGAIPDQVSFSLTDTHDVTAFRARDWTTLRGWTVVMDRGYYSHQTFAALGEAGVSWLCPLHAQASVDVTTRYPVDPAPTADGDVVLADDTITLGSPNNRQGAVLSAVRRVTSRNRHGEVRAFVTDRHDLAAVDVVMLYRQRWRIELFFRWLKHQLGVLHPLGHSPQAVLLTLWLAVIVAVLLTLLTDDRPRHLSDVAWLRAVGHILFTTIRDSS